MSSVPEPVVLRGPGAHRAPRDPRELSKSPEEVPEAPSPAKTPTAIKYEEQCSNPRMVAVRFLVMRRGSGKEKDGN